MPLSPSIKCSILVQLKCEPSGGGIGQLTMQCFATAMFVRTLLAIFEELEIPLVSPIQFLLAEVGQNNFQTGGGRVLTLLLYFVVKFRVSFAMKTKCASIILIKLRIVSLFFYSAGVRFNRRRLPPPQQERHRWWSCHTIWFLNARIINAVSPLAWLFC